MVAWMRIITRLRSTVGSAIRPASLPRPGKRSSPLLPVRLRLVFADLPPVSLLRPVSTALIRPLLAADYSELRPARLRPASTAVLRRLRTQLAQVSPASSAILARLRPSSTALRRLLRAQPHPVRPAAEVQILRGADDLDVVGDGTARVVLTALLRRLRRRTRWNVWEAVKDALPDYKKLKKLYEKFKKHFKKKKRPQHRRLPQPTPPVREPALPTPAPPLTRSWDRSLGWCILSRVPVVSDPGQEEITEVAPGEAVADFIVELRVPLAISSIAARSELVSPVPVAPGQEDNYPYIVALDEKTGAFLVRALPADEDTISFLLCNGATGEATPLPGAFAERLALVNVGDIGLACYGVDHLVIALRPLPGGRATLERFHLSSDEACWEDPADVGYPLGDRPWGSNGVVSHAGRLFFTDLAQGLLACKPLEDVPELMYVMLPEGNATAGAGADAAKRSCVTVSDGALMYVQIAADEPRGGGVVISTWSLRLDGAPASWTPKMQVHTTLFGSQPILALLHPRKPDVVSLCLSFGICSFICLFDLATEALLDARPLALPSVPRAMLSSRFFFSLAM